MNEESTHIQTDAESEDFPARAVRQGEDNERLIGTAMNHYHRRSMGWLGSHAERRLVQDKLMQEMVVVHPANNHVFSVTVCVCSETHS